LEEKEGEKIEPTIERVAPDRRYSGRVLLDTSHYVVLQKLQDRAQVSVHRKSKLDRVVKVGEEITIKYTGKQGAVS
jgi:type IV secretion system protein VirD4